MVTALWLPWRCRVRLHGVLPARLSGRSLRQLCRICQLHCLSGNAVPASSVAGRRRAGAFRCPGVVRAATVLLACRWQVLPGVAWGPGSKKGPERIRALWFGGAEEDRTPDLRIANATLSQLSYRPIVPADSTPVPVRKPRWSWRDCASGAGAGPPMTCSCRNGAVDAGRLVSALRRTQLAVAQWQWRPGKWAGRREVPVAALAAGAAGC